MVREIRRRIPRPIKLAARRVTDSTLDVVDTLLGRRDSLTPPRRISFVGRGRFTETGEEFLRYFVSLCALRPDERVLDVGCGIGRMAIPLTRFLSPAGSYDGFDIVPQGIEWCNSRIAARHPNFRFQLADVHNPEYNPGGRYRAAEYRFPFEAETFDFVFLTSVFTHMLPPDMERYLEEIARVLRPGGRCLITWFLMNGESLQSVESGSADLDFRHDFGDYRAVDGSVPEKAVAYAEHFVLDRYRRTGLRQDLPIRYGTWCGRAHGLSIQDIIIARK